MRDQATQVHAPLLRSPDKNANVVLVKIGGSDESEASAHNCVLSLGRGFENR